MRSYLYIALAMLGFAFNANAQYNLSTTYVSHNDLSASRYEPSELELGDRRFQLSTNAYVWAGNTSLNYGLFKNVFGGSGTLSSTDVNNIVAAFDKRNLIGGGFDVQYLGLAYQIRSKSDSSKRYDVSLSVVGKFGANFNFSNDLMNLVWKGNKQFAGRTVDLGNTNFNAHWYTEYALGFAMPLFGNDGRGDGIGMRVGARVKYLQGMASVRMTKSEAKMTTASDGSSITMEYDYEVHTAGISDAKNMSFFKGKGAGFGFDLGAALFIGSKIEFNASLMDVGSVKYKTDTKTYSKSDTYTYDGAIISELFGDPRLSETPGYIFSPNQSLGQPFNMPLGTKLLLQAEFKSPKTQAAKNPKRRDREYVSDAVYVTYVQGLDPNAPGTTTRPFVSVAYNHDFHKNYDVGAMVGYGGYNGLTAGAFFSLSVANMLKIGVGSDNLLPLIVPESGTGIDVAVSMSLSF